MGAEVPVNTTVKGLWLGRWKENQDMSWKCASI